MAEEESSIDPRIQVELEKLNVATESINSFEVELDEAKHEFKKLLLESIERIKLFSKKLENSVQLAKPYYEARLYSCEIAEFQRQAAAKYDKARSFNSAAKEMVFLAEQGLGKKPILDTACQEMLSHATSRVNETQQHCAEMERALKICEVKQRMACNKVADLQTQLKSVIKLSSLKIRRHLLFINIIAYQHGSLFLPYYETRSNNLKNLNDHKKRIVNLESKVVETKATYNDTLRSLELISEEIHKMRQDRSKLIQQHSDNYFEHSKSNKTVDYLDEYLDFPSNSITPDNVSDTHLETFPRSQGYAHIDATDDTNTDNWTEIVLTQSPASDEVSNGKTLQDDVNDDDDDGDDDDEDDVIVNGKTAGTEGTKIGTEKNLSNWITKSNLKTKDRRQSLDILYDASDKVKDVFTQGFQKVGRSLERRNSESEASLEFFLFSRSDQLTDGQIKNLLLSRSLTSLYDEYLSIAK